MLDTTIYLIISSLMIGSSLGILVTRNPVHSILYLILTFAWLAVFLIMIGIEFLAMLVMIVYIGAIAVLFLFVVMLLNIRVIELNQQMIKYSWIGALISVAFVAVVFYSYYYTFTLSFEGSEITYINWILFVDETTNMGLLGQIIYTLYSPLFIIASIILLVSMIGPIILTLDSSKSNAPFKRGQSISQQMLRRAYHGA